VGADGTIYNTVTDRPEYVPVRAAAEAPRATAATDVQPRVQDERREPEITRRIAEAREQHQLPDVDGLNYSQRGELYSRLYLEGTDAAGRQAFEAGERVICAMRVPTNVRANEGNGLYDDRIVILQRREDGQVALLHEGKASTEPAGRYEDGGPFQAPGKKEGEDVEGDGARDLGRVHAGRSVEMGWAFSAGRGPVVLQVDGSGRNVLKPVEGARVPVDREVDHDGRFTRADEVAQGGVPVDSLDRSFLIHKGDETINPGSTVPQHHTWSGGCSTMPGSEFGGSFSRSLEPTSAQRTFRYSIVEL
jgi:hypothetical protein